MRNLDETNAFEKTLETHLQTWRDVTPPPHLQARVAAAVVRSRPKNFPWRPLIAAGACAAAFGVFLAWPGSPIQPVPAFAEVERAMGSVETMSYTSTVDSRFSDGIVEKEIGQTWVRRYPPATARESVARLPGMEMKTKSWSDEKQRVTFEQRNSRPGKWKVYPQEPSFARDVERTLLLYTQPGEDDPRDTQILRTKYTTVLPPWIPTRALLNGRPVWVFTRTNRYDPNKPEAQQHGISRHERTVIRLFADTKTYRVVRQELRMTSTNESGHRQSGRRITLTDFRYNEPAPPTLRALQPPGEMTR